MLVVNDDDLDSSFLPGDEGARGSHWTVNLLDADAHDHSVAPLLREKLGHFGDVLQDNVSFFLGHILWSNSPCSFRIFMSLRRARHACSSCQAVLALLVRPRSHQGPCSMLQGKLASSAEELLHNGRSHLLVDLQEKGRPPPS